MNKMHCGSLHARVTVKSLLDQIITARRRGEKVCKVQPPPSAVAVAVSLVCRSFSRTEIDHRTSDRKLRRRDEFGVREEKAVTAFGFA